MLEGALRVLEGGGLWRELLGSHLARPGEASLPSSRAVLRLAPPELALRIGHAAPPHHPRGTAGGLPDGTLHTLPGKINTYNLPIILPVNELRC